MIPEMEQLTSEKAIELDQEFEVNVVALGSLSVACPDVMAIKIDTYVDIVVSQYFETCCTPPVRQIIAPRCLSIITYP